MLEDNSTRAELEPFTKQQRLELELLFNLVVGVLSHKRLLIVGNSFRCALFAEKVYFSGN